MNSTTSSATNLVASRTAEIQDWIVENLAAQLQVAPETIDPKQSFMELGLESIAIFTLTGDLAEWLGRELPATSLWEYPTIEALSHHLAEENA